jgi:sugar/nucleoside kinase (ribokinase family)
MATLYEQLHNSATHAVGYDPACPLCNLPPVAMSSITVRHYHGLYERLPANMKQMFDDAYAAARKVFEEHDFVVSNTDPAEELIADLVKYIHLSLNEPMESRNMEGGKE